MAEAELKRSVEFQANPLGGGWMEVRIIYKLSPVDDDHAHHSFNSDASRDIGHFILSFAAALSLSLGFLEVSNAIQRVWDHFHAKSGCPHCRVETDIH